MTKTQELSTRTKKELIDEFREDSIRYQKPVLDGMDVPLSHFSVKPGWFVPKGKTIPGISADERIIGLFPNECAKGYDLYMELYDLDIKPLEGRPLYRWKYNPFYMDEIPQYTNNTTGQISFIVPVAELEVINVENVLINGITGFEMETTTVKPLSTKTVSTPAPTTANTVKTKSSITTEFCKLTAQEVAAILWRLPISGNEEIDGLIKNYK
jgi:hypothetical protein